MIAGKLEFEFDQQGSLFSAWSLDDIGFTSQPGAAGVASVDDRAALNAAEQAARDAER